MRWGAATAVGLAVGFGLACGTGWAQGFPGTGALSGRAKLKVRGCGKAREPATLDVVVAADGTWSLVDGESQLAGAGTILGKAARKLRLALDAPSTELLASAVASGAAGLCGVDLQIAEVTVRKAILRVNKKATRARLVAKVVARGAAPDGSPGRGAYRVVASGPWVGPFDCEEVFECTRLCEATDVACAEGCLARGSTAAQAAVTALLDCVAIACPLGDPLCVDAALDGACAAEHDACVPPPPPTDLTCEEVFECADQCDGRQGCIDDCFERGSSRGRDDAEAVSSCVGRVCPSGGAGCVASALAGACAYVWEDCTGTRPPTNLGCAGIVDCQLTCANAACMADCFDRGSAQGRLELEDLDACIDAACPTRAPACVNDTITGQCRSEWATCLG
jgi:hypothetical protein